MDKKKLKSVLLLIGIGIVWSTLFYTQEIAEQTEKPPKVAPTLPEELPYIEIE